MGERALHHTVEPPADTPPAEPGSTDLPPPPTEPPAAHGEVPGPEEPVPLKWRTDPTLRQSVSYSGRVEHVDFGARVVSFNVDHPNRELLNTVADELRHGVPDSWEKIPKPGRNAGNYRHDQPGADGEPTLFVKPKDTYTPQQITQTVKNIEDQFRGTADEAIAAAQAYEWLAARTTAQHELEMAPEVDAVVHTSEAQALARQYGYNGLTYVKPLAVITDKATGSEQLVYPWQRGQSTIDPTTSGLTIPGDTYQTLHVMTQKLDNIFERHGIISEDLNAKQLRIETHDDGTQTLHLIDTERYHRKISGG
jgi:hypothetical protein